MEFPRLVYVVTAVVMALGSVGVASVHADPLTAQDSLAVSPSSVGPGWGTIDPNGDGFDDNPETYLPLADGSVYAGGSFTEAGGAPALKVAYWNGTAWSPLGPGVTDSRDINALAEGSDDSIYATGTFTAPETRIGRWDGSTWSSLGSGLNGEGYALGFASDDSLYVGGAFTSAGGVSVNAIARWNGATWSDVGGGISPPVGLFGNVRDIAITSDDSVYISGDFAQAGGKTMNNVALWNDDTWLDLDGGLDGRAVAMALTNDDTLFVAGEFTTAGSTQANGIAMWNGSEWSALGFGVSVQSGFSYRDLYGLAYDDTNGLLYVSGIFEQGCGDLSCSTSAADRVPMNYIGAWDVRAQAWIPLISTGINGTANYARTVTLSPDASKLYVGGFFSSRGGVTMEGPAVWQWPAPEITTVSPGSGPTGTSTVVTVNGTSLAAVDDVTIDGTSVPFTRQAITGDIQVTVPAGSGDRLIRVVAVGGTSAPVTFVQQDNPVVQPASAPQDVVAVGADRMASLSWAAPASSGSFPVTNYQVQSRPSSPGCLVPVGTTACEVSGLRNGVEYSFRVRALTGAGWGTWSEPVLVTPVVVESILITGARDGRRVQVDGVTTGLVGAQVTPWVRFPGPQSYVAGTGVQTVSADGTFIWQRITGKKIYVYFRASDGVRSNRLIISAR